MFEKKVVAILFIINILLLCVLVIVHLRLDKKPPVITVNDTITYSKDTSEQEILSVIKAVDEVDGDVSGTLVIEKIVPNEGKKKAWVTCGAKDMSENISKYTFCISCDESVFDDTEEAGDVFQLAVGEAENMLVNSEGVQDTFLDSVKEATNELIEATDEVTEENTGGETETETVDSEEELAEVEEEEAEVVEQEERQTPSMLQQAADSLGGVPNLVLATNEVKTKKGYNPAWVTVIAQLTDDIDSYDILLKNIKIQGIFDNTVVGSYDVMVSTVDSEGNESVACPLRIIVEE